MAYELDDAKVKYTLLLQKAPKGKIRHSGFIRVTDSNGVSKLRLTTNVDAGTHFDDFEILPEFPDPDSAYGVTNMQTWSMRTA